MRASTGLVVNPVDGTIWGSVLGYPGYSSGSHRGRTHRRRPWRKCTSRRSRAFGPRGFDIDRNGVAYVPLSSGHLAPSIAASARGPLNGPSGRRGQAVSRRLDAYPVPGTTVSGNVAESGSAEASY